MEERAVPRAQFFACLPHEVPTLLRGQSATLVDLALVRQHENSPLCSCSSGKFFMVSAHELLQECNTQCGFIVNKRIDLLGSANKQLIFNEIKQ